MALTHDTTQKQEFSAKGMKFLRKAVLAVLIEAQESGDILNPQEISDRLGIPPIKTKLAPSKALIANSILCNLETKGHVKRCDNEKRGTWRITSSGINYYQSLTA